MFCKVTIPEGLKHNHIIFYRLTPIEKYKTPPFRGGTRLSVIVSMGDQDVSNKMKIVCEGCKVKFDSEKEFKEHSLKTGHTVWAKEERKGW